MASTPTEAQPALFLYDIRCAACHRMLGVSGKRKWAIYCDAFCAQDIPAVEEEARDAIIEAVLKDTEHSGATLGAIFDLTRQRVLYIAKDRDLRVMVRK